MALSPVQTPTPSLPFPPMRKAELMLRQGIHVVTGARRKNYGKPERNFETIAKYWDNHIKTRIRTRYGDEALALIGDKPLIETVDVPTLMILLKAARLAETPNHGDSYRDAAGYAACGAEVADCDLTDITILADSPAMPARMPTNQEPIKPFLTSIATLPAEDDPNGRH